MNILLGVTMHHSSCQRKAVVLIKHKLEVGNHELQCIYINNNIKYLLTKYFN